MPSPIMDAGFYLRNPQGKTRKVSDGKGGTRRERLPSSAGRRRHRAILRDDGNVVFQPLTSHSANLDMESSQAHFYINKSRRHGWIPTAQCPVVLVMGGQLDKLDLCPEVLADLAKGKGCQASECSEDAPCKHVLMEQKARQSRRLAVETKRAKAHSTTQDREIQAQRDTQATIGAAMEKMTEVLSATKEGKSEASK